MFAGSQIHDDWSGTALHAVDPELGAGRDGADHHRARASLVDAAEAIARHRRARTVHAQLHELLDLSGDLGAVPAPRIVGGYDVVDRVVMRLVAVRFLQD